MKKLVIIIMLMLISLVINVYCFGSKDSDIKGVNIRKDLMEKANSRDTKYIKAATGQLINKLKAGNYLCITDTLASDLTTHRLKKLEKKLEKNCKKDIKIKCVRAEKCKNPSIWEAECEVSGGDTIYFKFCSSKHGLRLYNVL